MGQLIEQLKRRGVLRVAAAYLAVVWLILQVMDVLQGILSFPTYVGVIAFLVMLIGFPIALVLAWAYDVTPAGIIQADHAETAAPAVKFGGRRIDAVIIAALCMVIVLLVVDNYLPDIEQLMDSGEVPVVSQYRQLTRSPVLLPPFPSHIPIVADESRLYFNSWDSGKIRLNQMSRAGGDAFPIDPPFEEPRIVIPNAMVPDGTHLSISSFKPGRGELSASLWLLPVVGGAPRKQGTGALAAYSADGEQMVFATGHGGEQLMLARSDFSEARHIADAPGTVHWPALSPDGREIRFYIPKEGTETLWRVPLQEPVPSPLFANSLFTSQCCGSWTPDGKYFVFQATVGGRTQLWALQDRGASHMTDAAAAVQITAGPLDFMRPTLVDGGRTIYAMAWQLQGEVVQLHRESGRFTSLPGLEGLSAERITYSRDEQWIAYISYPEGSLWRSTSSGKKRLQLTQHPMRIGYFEWSPDGKTIAFGARKPGEPERIHLVSVEGGTPRLATEEGDLWQWSPSWSPDGSSLVFSEENQEKLQLLDLASGKVSGFEGTEGLRTPVWSPDGRYLVLGSLESLQLFDIESRRVELLTKDSIDFFYWGKESRYLYLVQPHSSLPSVVRRMDIHSKKLEIVAEIDEDRMAHGVRGVWVGVTPKGLPMYLRDISIHHIYALSWLPEAGPRQR